MITCWSVVTSVSFLLCVCTSDISNLSYYHIRIIPPTTTLLFPHPTYQITTNIIWIKAKKCNEAALSLLVCMEKTECVMKKKKSLEECMKNTIDSDPCLAVRNAYYNCKHSQLNMRTRIRGVRQYWKGTDFCYTLLMLYIVYNLLPRTTFFD